MAAVLHPPAAGGMKRRILDEYYAVNTSHNGSGQGAFGSVYILTPRSGGVDVVGKEFKSPNAATIMAEQEARMIKSVGPHPNIIVMFDAFRAPQLNRPDYEYLVLEKASCDIAHVLLQRKGGLAEPEVRHIMRMLLKATVHMHGKGVVHCDLKPANLVMMDNHADLVVTDETIIKVVDFGLARQLDKVGASYNDASHQKSRVVTKPYRAPEVHMGARLNSDTCVYGRPIDMWSIGCIFAELFNGKVLFRGEVSSMNRTRHLKPGTAACFMVEIINLVGAPPDAWKEWGKMMPIDFDGTIQGDYPTQMFHVCEGIRSLTPFERQAQMKRIAPSMDDSACELLANMLDPSPATRITAAKALEHAWMNRR